MENQLTIDLKEAALILGFKSVWRLREKAKRGQIPGAFKAGRNWMFYKPDLIDWMRTMYIGYRNSANY